MRVPVPNSFGSMLMEGNDCHLPAGRPDGGQFCAKETPGLQEMPPLRGKVLPPVEAFKPSREYHALRGEKGRQQELADQQTNPLAHPVRVLGLGLDEIGLPDKAVVEGAMRYVAAYGEEFKAGPLPEGVEYGQMGDCYKNATMLVFTHPDLDYVEGFAYPPISRANGSEIAVLHGWAVTKDGQVVDPTWRDSAETTYFGVRYDRKAYLKHIVKAKFFGLLGSTLGVARRVIRTGGKGLRAEKTH